MKIKFFILVFFLFKFASVIANDLENADSLFLAHKFEEASRIYEALSIKNAQICFRLGCCYIALDQKGKSISYFKKAEKLASLNSKSVIRKYINHIKGTLDNRPMGYVSYFKDLVNYWIEIIPLIIFQLLFLLTWLFFLFYLSGLYIKNKKSLVIYALFLILIICGIFLIQKYRISALRVGISIDNDSRVLSGPGDNFYLLDILPEGSEFKILDSCGDHFKIKFRNQVGWVRKTNVEVI